MKEVQTKVEKSDGSTESINSGEVAGRVLGENGSHSSGNSSEESKSS